MVSLFVSNDGQHLAVGGFQFSGQGLVIFSWDTIKSKRSARRKFERVCGLCPGHCKVLLFSPNTSVFLRSNNNAIMQLKTYINVCRIKASNQNLPPPGSTPVPHHLFKETVYTRGNSWMLEAVVLL